jgi:hypothetical protein
VQYTSAAAGATNDITGSNLTYGQGGRGSDGYSGADDGVTNTGMGGDGGTGNTTGAGAGGSGIVIIRYQFQN